MEKSTILSKLNLKLKDYNNQLEKILEGKLFSFDVKNLLLSMLYKIENSYEDYRISKVEVPSKNEYIENLLRIIKEKVLKIFIVKPETPEAEELEQKHLKYKIDKTNGEITCFQNELIILTALLELDQVDANIKVPYSYIEKPLNLLLQKGKLISDIEVIRDFNGWSWDISVKQIRDIEANFIYQNILLLNGRKNIISSKKSKKLYELVLKMAVQKFIKETKDRKYIEKLQNLRDKKQERMSLLENKKEFLEKVTEDKKKYTKQIEKIDILLNNNELLKEEYYNRNKKLPNKEKIFSVSYLVGILEKEREGLLIEIDECNKIILPKEFVEQKTKTEKELKFLNEVLEQELTEEDFIQMSILFLQSLKEDVENITEENKEKLIPIIYKLRYYGFVPFNREKSVKDLKELEGKFEELEKQILKKAIEFKIIDSFSEDEELTYEILKVIFNTKIISLENINIECKYEEKVLYVEYYDDTVLETTVEIKREKVKIKKKFKVFLR